MFKLFRNGVLCAGLMSVALGLAACQPDEEVVGEMRIVEFDVIAELTTEDGARLTFTREPISEDSDEYTVGVKMIGRADGAAYGRYIMEQGLTPLEIFASFAPAGAEPPAELRESHVAAGRPADEIRTLLMPRAGLSTMVDHPECDDYDDFLDGVANTMAGQLGRQQVTSNSTANQTIGKNGFQQGYGRACNADDLNGDAKNIYMCRKLPTDVWFTCDWETVDDGEFAWKVWGSSGSTLFNYQLVSGNLSGQTRRSFLGLVVAMNPIG